MSLLVRSMNLLCVVLGVPFFISMVVYPFSIGNWEHVHSVWHYWQSLNAGILAFVASVIALNAVKYSEEKKRQRTFVAARAFLPQALSELSRYFESCSEAYIEAWFRAKDENDRCKSSLKSPLPKIPDNFQKVFKECIAEAQPNVGEHLAYILMRLQIHQSRIESMYSEFSKNSEDIQIHYNIMSYIFALAELQCLINQLFGYSRGIEDFDNSPLKMDSFVSVYGSWNIEDENDLIEFTERNHSKRWNTHKK